MPRWLTLPTLFTLSRVVMTPFVVYAILNQRHGVALAIFAAAAATDAVDGYLARQMGMATAVGAYLDPIADKLLLSTVYVVLAVVRSIPWWLPGVIFARDLLILGSSGVALMVTSLRAFPPSGWGKASTFFQILTATSFLILNATGLPLVSTVSEVLIWPTLALTVWSGVHYGWRGLRLVRMH
jgi:cardiolipin synthase